MGIFDGLAYRFEAHDVAVFLTLIFLEGVLSFDNAAVIAAMVRRLPPHQRRKALFYGLAGAYAFRFTAILLAAFLIDNMWIRIVGGAYLLFLMGKHVLDRRKGEHEASLPMTLFGMSAFWSTIVLVESADLVFALDQIVVAVALTEKLVLIIAASFLAILALRLSAIYMIRLMDWFPPLETLAYVAVGWVGFKLLLIEFTPVEVPKSVSIAVTLGLLVVPLLAKLVWDLARHRLGPRRRHTSIEAAAGVPPARPAEEPTREPAPE